MQTNFILHEISYELVRGQNFPDVKAATIGATSPFLEDAVQQLGTSEVLNVQCSVRQRNASAGSTPQATMHDSLGLWLFYCGEFGNRLSPQSALLTMFRNIGNSTKASH